MPPLIHTVTDPTKPIATKPCVKCEGTAHININMTTSIILTNDSNIIIIIIITTSIIIIIISSIIDNYIHSILAYETVKQDALA